MVFENVVVAILKKYIGKYVKNLDGNNLSIGLWSGELTLCDLELKHEALAGLDLPIEITSGYIGKLSLSIPWKSIYVEPVVARIEDVFVITAPRTEFPYDEEKEKRFANVIKQNQLKLLNKAEQKTFKEEAKKENDTLTEKLTAQILKNLQIFIRSIHIRYEDKITNPKSPFAVGITLNELSMQTSDENWLPAYVDGSVRQIYKAIILDSLALYWNCHSKELINANPQWKKLIKHQIAKGGASNNHLHDFILKPLNLGIEIKIDQEANVKLNLPKFVADVILKKLSLEISKLQFESIMELVASFELMSINYAYRKYRPQSTVLQDKKAWWKYIIDSYVETVYRPWTWQAIRQHRVKYRDYVSLYKDKLTAIHQKKQTKILAESCLKLEEELDLANILIARKQAENEFNAELESGLFTSSDEPIGWLEWMGLTNHESDDVTNEEIKFLSLAAFTEEEKERLYQAIGYANDTQHPVYERSYVRSMVSFRLDRGSIALKTSQHNERLDFNLTKLHVTLIERPASEGYGLECSVEGVNIRNGTKDIVVANADRLFWSRFDINPVSVQADYSVEVLIEPLNVTFDKNTFKMLTDFFTTPNAIEMDRSVASSKLEDITLASRAGMEFAITHNKVLYLNVNMKCPLLTIPICDNSCLQVNLGNLTVVTNLQSELKHQCVREATENDLETMFYYQIDVNVSRVFVAIVQDSTNYILPPSDFNIQIFKSLKSGYANFPDLKFVNLLPPLTVDLSEENISKLFQLMLEFTSSEVNEVEEDHLIVPSTKYRRSSSVVRPEELQVIQVTSLKQPPKVQEKSLESGSSNQASRTEIIFNLEIKKLCVSYESTDGRFDLILSKITCEGSFNTHCKIISSKLGCIQLVHSLDKGVEHVMIQSREEEDIISIQLTQADPSGSDFATVYNKTEFSLSVHMGFIMLNIQQQSIVPMQLAVNNLVNRLNDQTTPQPVARRKQILLLNIPEEVEDVLPQKPPSSKLKMPKSQTNVGNAGKSSVACEFTFSGMEVRLEEIANLLVNDLRASVSVNEKYTKLAFLFKDIAILDLYEVTNYSSILAVSSEKLFTCEVVIFNEVERTSVSPDIKLSLDVGKLKCYVVADFLIEMQNFAQDLAKNFTQDSPKRNLPKDGVMTTKFELAIAVDAPDIILPLARDLTEALRLDLGHVDVSSSLGKVEEVIYEVITIKGKDFSFSSCTGNIIVPVCLTGEVKRSLNTSPQEVAVHAQFPLLEVNVLDDWIDDALSIIQTFAPFLQPPSHHELKERSSEEIALIDDSVSINLSLHADIQKIVVCCGVSSEDQIISVHAEKLTVDLLASQHTMQLALTMKQLEVLEISDERIKLVSSVDTKDLVNISYSAGEEGQNVKLALGKMDFFADDEAITSCLEYITSLTQRVIEGISFPERGCPEEIVEKPENSGLNMKIQANLAGVTLTCKFASVLVTTIHMQGFDINIHLENKDVVVKSSMNTLLVEDLAKDTCYKEIVSLQDKNLLSVEFSLKEVDENEQRGSLWLRIGRVKLVFLYKFVQDLLNCLNNFLDLLKLLSPPQHTIEEKPNEAIDDISFEASAPPASSLFIGFDIDTTSPLILLPPTSRSKDYVAADLGRCVIENTLTESGVDKISVKLSQMKICVTEETCERQITEDMLAKVAVSRSLAIPLKKLNVAVDIAPVTVVLSDKQIQFLMDVFASNFSEEGKTPTVGLDEDHLPLEEDDLPAVNEPLVVQVSVQCQKMMLSLTSNHLFRKKSALGETTLCSLSASKIYMQLKIDNETSVQLSISRFQAKDARPYSQAVVKNIFEKVVVQEHHHDNFTTNDDQLVVKFNTNANLQNITTQLGNGKVNMNLDFLYDLLEFLQFAFVTEQPPKNDDNRSRRESTSENRSRRESSLENRSRREPTLENHSRKDSSLENRSRRESSLENRSRRESSLENRSRRESSLENRSRREPTLENHSRRESTLENRSTRESTLKNRSRRGSMEAKLKLTCKLKNIDLILIEDHLTLESPVIINQLNSTFTYSQEGNETSMKLANTMLSIFYGHYSEHQDDCIQLLQPCLMDIGLEMADDRMEMEVGVRRMIFLLSPSILSTVINITDNLTGQQTIQESGVSDIQETETTVDWSSRRIPEEEIDDALPVSNSWDREMRNEEMLEERKNAKETLNLKVDMIELTLGDDLEGMLVPLLMLNVPCTLKLLDWSSKISLDSDFTISADLFNDNFATWEPFIEPNQVNGCSQPYEINIRSFYAPSKKVDFSSGSTHKEASSATEGVDVVDGDHLKNLYLLVSSEGVLQINVKSQSIHLLYKFAQAWSMEALRRPVTSESVSPFCFQNQLGVAATIWIEKGLKSSVEGNQIKILQKQPNSLRQKSSSTSDLNLPSSPTGGRKVNFSIKEKPSKLPTGKMQIDTEIDVQVQGHVILRNVSMKASGAVKYKLNSQKSGEESDVFVNIQIVNGRRMVTLTSTILLFNVTARRMKIFANNTLANTLESHQQTCLPLLYSKVERIAVRYEGCTGEKFVSVKDVANGERTISCLSDGRAQFIKVVTSEENSLKKITFAPVLAVTNVLPRTITLITEQCDESSKVHVMEAGSRHEIENADFSKLPLQMTVEYCENEMTWRNSLFYHAVVGRKVLLQMTSQQSQLDQTLEICTEQRNGLYEVQIYTGYWLVNKTQLNLQFKNSFGNIYNVTQGAPSLIKYSNDKKEKGAIRVDEGNWSDSFTINVVGDEFTIDCQKNQQNYKIYSSIKMSSVGLTYIITFSPTYLVVNRTQLDLVFAEETQEPDWIELPKKQTRHIWLASKGFLLLKEHQGAYVGPLLPLLSREYKSAKRLSSGTTVCVEINVIGEQRVMTVHPYQTGCIPLQIYNYCPAPVFIKQRDVDCMNNVREIQAKQHEYYSWRDLSKTQQLLVSANASQFAQLIDSTQDGFGEIDDTSSDDYDLVDTSRRHHCLCCCTSCLPCREHAESDEEDAAPLITTREVAPLQRWFWVCYMRGMQRVLAFTTDIHQASRLNTVDKEEYVTMETFVSLSGIGLSLINSLPAEISYVSISGGTSVWQVKSGKHWKTLDVETSTFLEDAYQNKHTHAESRSGKIKADLVGMMLHAPREGELQRSQDPALWLHMTRSTNNTSLHISLHRMQMDNQQYDVVFPSAFYPTPLSSRIIKRNGVKPLVEMSIVYRMHNEVIAIRYLKVLLQEISLKLDRDMITALIGFYEAQKVSQNKQGLFNEDVSYMQQTIAQSIQLLLGSKSTMLYLESLHLSPVKLHLSFSMQSQREVVTTSREQELFEWLVSAVGIHFTDISDVIIKLAYFERKSVLLSQDVLITEATKHYAMQAVKQFHVLVLGLDVLGNPYGLISEYGQGFKDLFYEPYLGSVGGPHEFAQGLVYGVKSLLGHTVGGTAGAASLIAEQLGQVVAALSFDSDYKKKRRHLMHEEPTGIKDGLTSGGKQFVLGFVFGVSGLFTKPVQGARRRGVEGFFKGIGKGLIGLLVKPTGGVIDLLTSSLDGVRRFAEQGGEDMVCRVRLPRVTMPNKSVTVYSQEKAYGFGLLNSLVNKDTITGYYTDHVAIGDAPPTVAFFTTEMLVVASQRKFLEDWKMLTQLKLSFIDDVIVTNKLVELHVRTSNHEISTISVVELNCTSTSLAQNFYDTINSHLSEL